MTIILPLGSNTLRSVKWAALLLGGKIPANALLVPHATDDPSAIVEAIRPLFQSVDVLPTYQVGIDNVWQDVHSHFKRAESTEPWFWWQHDFTLLRADAWPLILAHSVRSDLPFGQIKSPKDLLSREIFHTGEPDFRIAFHVGNNDGSLIADLLAERNSTSVNVPQHAMEYFEPARELLPDTLTVDILYVTYAKDFPWLEYSLRSVKKFGVGFRRVIVAVPECDVSLLEEVFDKAGVDNEDDQFPGGFEIYPYQDAPPGKGFVMHAAKICQADLITDAAYILHMDSDCIMKEENDAGHYFMHGLPVMPWKPYESLRGPRLSGVVSDCYQWKVVSERTLGMPLNAYTMVRHPTIYPRQIYKPFRDQVERTQGEPFEQWFCKQKNNHPQGVAEFPSLGGFCYERFRHLFTWIDVTVAAPRDLMKAYWSHEGPDQYVGEGWHDGKPVGANARKTKTARQEIEEMLA